MFISKPRIGKITFIETNEDVVPIKVKIPAGDSPVLTT